MKSNLALVFIIWLAFTGFLVDVDATCDKACAQRCVDTGICKPPPNALCFLCLGACGCKKALKPTITT